MSRVPRYVMDPEHPRMPPHDVWLQFGADERACVIASLPTEFPVSEAAPPEGDPHSEPMWRARDVLRRYFGRIRRGVYVGTNLPVWYPDENMFAPDVLVVLDVDPHARERWAVDLEGKGLDLVVEIHVAGARSKDVRDNVTRYARLGIREYFVFEVRRSRLLGFRLQTGRAIYQPVLAQGGLYASDVLGLDIGVEGGRLRFYHDLAPLPEAEELIARLQAAADTAEHRAEEEARRAEEETRRAEEETRRAEEETRRAEEEARLRTESERRLAEALAEIARLKGEKPT